MSTATASPAASTPAVVASFTTQDDILKALRAGTITVDQASKRLASMDSASKANGTSVVANPEKGTVSVRGIQRMPVTLYPNQWRLLLGEELLPEGTAGRKVQQFIITFNDYLPATKDAKPLKKVPAELIGEGKPFRIPKVQDS